MTIYTVSGRQWLLTQRILWALLILSVLAIIPALIMNSLTPWSAVIGVFLAAFSLVLLRTPWREGARWMVALAPTTLIFVEGVLMFPPSTQLSGFEWMLLSCVMMPTLVFRATEWRKMALMVAFNIALVLVFPFVNDAVRLTPHQPELLGPLFRGVSVGFGVLLLVSGLYNLLNVNYRVESHVVQLLDDSREKNEELRAQNDIIAEQNRDITDSIVYARRIQQAILPSLAPLHQRGIAAEVLYAPKAIVSGDFYWCHAEGPRITVAALDCTGHGVPGAFMSVLGYSLLNQLAARGLAFRPGDLLNELDDQVYNSLRQHSEAKDAPLDGMDAVVLCIDTEARTLTWASANRPLAYVPAGGATLEWEKGQKRAIGGSRFGQEPFETQTVAWQPGMRLFLFTDGITDMNGGPQGRKFTPKRLAEWMQTTANLPLGAQLDNLTRTAHEWEATTEAIDDKLLIAVELPGEAA